MKGLLRRRRKHAAELAYWRDRLAEDGRLGGEHYRFFYTEFFGLDEAFYAGARMLDVGCGPRGSLDWATGARERVGLDPLAGEYLALRDAPPATRLVTGRAERIPFADAHFDVASSFNSFDHVDDPPRAAAEIARVVSPGGTFLLIVDVHQPPTATEPHEFDWALLDAFAGFEVADRREFERADETVLGSLLAGQRFDHARGSQRPGVLAARLVRHT